MQKNMEIKNNLLYIPYVTLYKDGVDHFVGMGL